MSHSSAGASGTGGDAYLGKDEGRAPMPSEVAAVFEAFLPAHREPLLGVRALILEVAAEAGVGPLTETLKWGEPAYLTEATKAGSTVRLGVKDGVPAVFFICHSGLVDGFQADFPELSYLGSRGIALGPELDRGALSICLQRALTFHRAKREARK